MIEYTYVTGTEKGQIRLYALSTCVWCKKTRKLLEKLGVSYEYIYVDLLEGNARDAVMDEIEKWNPYGSFPTIVINEKESIIGFKEDKIRELFA
jgi:glutaredoxin-like protein NrdH